MQSADTMQGAQALVRDGAGGDRDVPEPALRARQDILFAETPEGVLIKWGNSGYVLKGRTAYRWLANILPRLDGQHTMSDLLSGLDEPRAASVRQIVSSLVDRGVVQLGPPAEATAVQGLDEQVAFLGHFVPDAAAGLARVQAAAVQVRGSGAAAQACVAALIANGFDTVGADAALLKGRQVRAEAARAREHGRSLHLGEIEHLGEIDRATAGAAAAQLVVDLDLAASPSTVEHCATEAHRAGRTVVPVVVSGDRALVGPLWDADSAATLQDAWERYLAVGPPQETTVFRRRWLRRETLPVLPGSELSQSLLGNLVAFELFKHVSGVGAETSEHLIIFDLETTVGVAEQIIPLPDRFVAHGSTTDPVPAAEEPAPAPGAGGRESSRDLDSAWRDPLSTEWMELVGRHTGLIPDFDDLDIVQSPLKVGRLMLASPWATAGTTSVAGWSRSTIGEARDSAALHAMARYADGLAPALLPPVVTATDLATGEPETVDRTVVLGSDPVVLAAVTAAGWTPAEAQSQALDAALSVLALRALQDRTSPTARRVGLDPEQAEMRFLLEVAEILEVTITAFAHDHPGRRATIVVTATRPQQADQPAVDELAAATAARGKDAAAAALTELLARVQMSDAGDALPPREAGAAGLSAEALEWIAPGAEPLPEDEVSETTVLQELSRSGVRCLRVPLTPQDVASHATVAVARLLLRPDPR